MRNVTPFWNTGRRHFNPWLFVLAFVLVVGGCDGREEQQRLAQRLDGLSARLDAFEDAVQNQERVSQRQETIQQALQQILDNIPLKMPQEWEDRLAQLEGQMNNVDQWPEDAAAAEDFLEQVTTLVTDLPVLAERQYLPRLSPVRWAALAFVRLNPPPGQPQTPDRLDQLAEELHDLADAKPEGGSEQLVPAMRKYVGELAERAEKLNEQATRRRVADAVEQAKGFVPGGPGAAEVDVTRLHEQLLGLDETAPEMSGVDLPALRKKLYREVLRRQAVEQSALLRGRWDKAQELKDRQPKDQQPAVYGAAARMLLQQVASARVALVLAGVTDPVHDGLENELRDAVKTIEAETAKQAEVRQASAVRSYQQWALKEIRKFDDKFSRIAKDVKDAKPLLKKAPWNESFYQGRVEWAMANHLLPINLVLLDLPVQERYQKAFQDGWGKLDDEHQIKVAVAAAKTTKKPLREFLEDGS